VSEKLDEFREQVRAVIKDNRELFTPGRYPYTYASDFLRAHTDLIPADIVNRLTVVQARSDASRARTEMAERMGVEDVTLACVLADAYLIENNVVGHGKNFSQV
jgi:hypothetical protein